MGNLGSSFLPRYVKMSLGSNHAAEPQCVKICLLEQTQSQSFSATNKQHTWLWKLFCGLAVKLQMSLLTLSLAFWQDCVFSIRSDHFTYSHHCQNKKKTIVDIFVTQTFSNLWIWMLKLLKIELLTFICLISDDDSWLALNIYSTVIKRFV